MPQTRTQSRLSDRDRRLLFGDEALREGDAVVHFEHGLARYGGRTTVEVEGTAQDLTVFVYRHGGKLMLPAVEGRDFWPYGAPADDVQLDRLDAGDWTARRDAMIAELQAAADGLVDADRARRAQRARPLSPDADRFAAVEAGFPHAATADQDRAVAAVLDDLGRTVPMNRLLIGDVGYGKTEVALRAVAAAALAGRQAALAAPTTVLARQHAATLRDRLAPLGVAVVELSRLTAGADRDDALAQIASGAAQVVVGTHALLGEDVAFADLALTVIDEEQKFGRAQKVGLRTLAPGCHILSMTATPIPRSLAAAEIGLVDVSVLATPPAARHPVETRIARPAPDALRDAVAAEVARGGQAFVVCPRVADLARVAEVLAGTADVGHVVAHGQLPEDEMDARVQRFMDGDVDVLLSTTIVESGLDNPRANAMVVCDAETFGLTQLHQLRGRIGRADVPARMLLLSETDPDPDAEDDAARRLAAFAEMSEPGCGFRLARADRDLRGFGELDGEAQSGQVSRLGLGLYRHVLRTRAAA